MSFTQRRYHSAAASLKVSRNESTGRQWNANNCAINFVVAHVVCYLVNSSSTWRLSAEVLLVISPSVFVASFLASAAFTLCLWISNLCCSCPHHSWLYRIRSAWSKLHSRQLHSCFHSRNIASRMVLWAQHTEPIYCYAWCDTKPPVVKIPWID